MNLGEILDQVCREKDLDKNKYELRHPGKQHKYVPIINKLVEKIDKDEKNNKISKIIIRAIENTYTVKLILLIDCIRYKLTILTC